MDTLASAGSVQVACPACHAPLTVPVFAGGCRRIDSGVVEVDIVPDKTELQLHALVCAG